MKTYVIDIDGTICNQENGNTPDYTRAKPILERIDKVNDLYDSGNKIVYFTARGMGRTGGNSQAATDLFYQDTLDQLKTWGAKFHDLFLGKPAGDVYIDDKAISSCDFFEKQGQ
jgi:histidinol phosphatase-like enzyme